MGSRLFVGVMGHRNAGKSTTWNTLFGSTVRTGQNSRSLSLRPGECVDVFLISGSPEEREKYAGDLMVDKSAKIVLCSMQYVEHVQDTLKYIEEENFDFFVQWLNPGYSDTDRYFDRLGLSDRLLSQGAQISLRNGQSALTERVQELRECIYGWAAYRNLIYRC